MHQVVFALRLGLRVNFSSSQTTNAAERPNTAYILVDDMGCGDVAIQ